MRKIFTFLCAALMSVGMYATTEVTITQNDFPASGNSFTKDGVTVSAGMIDRSYGNIMRGGSFSTTLGNFTKIEVTASDLHSMSGDGWSGDNERQTWTGNASSVSFSGNIMGNGMGVTLKFTIEEPATVAVTGVTLNQNEAQMTVGGETLTLTATVNPNNATDQSVSWSTSDGDVATVDNGVVTAVAAGNATITVTTTDGSFTATCDVTVSNPAPSIKYYIVGNMTGWGVSADYEMTPNNVRVDTDEEYMFNITLTTASQFKVVKVVGETQTWYPDGMGNNYGEHGEIERDGDYTIYFRPALDGDDDWFYGCIMAIRHATPERVVVGALFPENGKPTEGVKIFGSFSEEEFDMTLITETGGYIHSEIMAADQDEFMFRDAADEENVLVVRNAEGQWEDAVFTFDEEWEEDTYKGAPVKMIDMDLSDNSKYAWANAIPEGLDEVLSDKAESRKVMIDGMLLIEHNGKLYNATGARVK